MGRKRFIAVLLLATLAALLFAALNPQVVDIELAVAQLHVPLGIVLIVVLALGLAAGVLIRGKWVAELLSERGRLRRALKAAEAKTRELVANRQSE